MDIEAPNSTKYALKVASVLFSENELAEGVISLANRRTDRSPLDPARVELLKEAIKRKFRAPDALFDAYWPVMAKAINTKGRCIKRNLAMSPRTQRRIIYEED